MRNPQISINYNGHRTAVTCLEDNIFYVQITPTPYRIQRRLHDDGTDVWIEIESNRETMLSKNLGHLIANPVH